MSKTAADHVNALVREINARLAQRGEPRVTDDEAAQRAGCSRLGVVKWRSRKDQVLSDAPKDPTKPGAMPGLRKSTKLSIARAYCLSEGVCNAYLDTGEDLAGVAEAATDGIVAQRMASPPPNRVAHRPNLERLVEQSLRPSSRFYGRWPPHAIVFARGIAIPHDLTLKEWLAELDRIRDLLGQKIIDEIKLMTIDKRG